MPKKKEEAAETKGQIAENAEASPGGAEDSSQKADTATAAAGIPENAGQPSEGSSASTDTSDAQGTATQDEDMGLESLNVLADRHRVPTWQQAALGRLMGWEAGKMVSNADYVSALDKLKSRPVGGGRMG